MRKVITFLWVIVAMTGWGAEPPNILMIISDDHSVPDLSCYGNKNLSTPNLDFLAENGVRFNRMYTASPQCAPSRKSFVTGRYPMSIRCNRFTTPIPAEVPTTMDFLRTKNYYTGILGRVHHLDGFDKVPESKNLYAEKGLNTIERRTDRVIGYRGDDQNHVVFKEFLDAVPSGRPFFAQLSYSNPHRALDAERRFVPDPEAITVPDRYPDVPSVRADLSEYYGEIQELDSYVGLIWDELKRRSLMDNTLILFIGDNGGALLRGKGFLYEPGLNVPFLVYWKNHLANPGGVSDAMLSGIDILPTLLEVTGIEPPSEIEGISFLPLLTGTSEKTRDYVFAERGGHGTALPPNNEGFDIIRCVISEDYKLIYNGLPMLSKVTPALDCWKPETVGGKMIRDLERRLKAGGLSEQYAGYFKTPRPTFELYDLENDPLELNNLYNWKKPHPEQKKLQMKLHLWMIANWDFLQLPVRE